MIRFQPALGGRVIGKTRNSDLHATRILCLEYPAGVVIKNPEIELASGSSGIEARETGESLR
jgi:hypothetical protein